MRVEVLRELEPADDELEIPWASSADPWRRYVDLRDCPEEIDQLEECRQYPPLGDLLRTINAPGSAFRSAKCDVWTTTELAEDERLDFRLPFKIGSYVDVVFERLERNSQLELHLHLAEKLRQVLDRFPVQAQMEIAVRRCLFHLEKLWGYSLTLFVHAYGSNTIEANEEWRQAIGALGDALAGISREF